MRYLVTGCAGFIGSTLTDALLADGCEVVGVDAFTDYYDRPAKESALADAREHPSFALLEHDLTDGILPDHALDGLDGIFHLAARPGVRASWGSGFESYVADNILGTHAVADAASARGIRLVFASSSSIYGDALTYPTPEDTPPSPISPYGVTKLACEHLLAAHARDAGLEHVTLRYFTVYGPRQRPDMAFARLIAALGEDREFEIYGDGSQSRDFTYVADAVAATLAAMRRAHVAVTYNVGGGSEASLGEVVGLVTELAGRPPNVRHGGQAPGDVRRTLADTTRIRSELGWEPRTDLSTGLEAQLRSAGALASSAR